MKKSLKTSFYENTHKILIPATMTKDFGLKLTESQKEVLNQLIQCRDANESISVRTIAANLGISTSLVSYTIKQFEKRGILKRNVYNPKDFTIIFSASKTPVYFVKFIEAKCGADGCLNEDEVIDSVPIPIHQFSIVNPEKAILIRARGDSMEPNIVDGDMVLAEKISGEPYPNRVYLVINNDQAFIKKFVKLNEHASLVSLNPSYKAIPINEETNTRFIAEVKGILRNKSI